MSHNCDVIIIGAGASGLICAREALKRKRSVIILDHAPKIAKKILISGGGKSNFTNLNVGPENYICSNKYFTISALSRFSPYDIIDLLEKYNIPWHERQHGQLFCDNSARDLVNALEQEVKDANIILNCQIKDVQKIDNGFAIKSHKDEFFCQSLIVASGGLSMPKIGASNLGHKIAKHFGHSIISPRAGLVPLRYNNFDAKNFVALSGTSLEAVVKCRNQEFKEQLLFTHRGLSGPVILQISNYFQAGDIIEIDFLPNVNELENDLKLARDKRPKQQLKNALCAYLTENFAKILCNNYFEKNNTLGSLSNNDISKIVKTIHNFQFKPGGDEGYRTAEVTIGGVNTNNISSKTMESKITDGLFFIGEVLDVAGHLGGFNFHWAWSSGSVAGKIA